MIDDTTASAEALLAEASRLAALAHARQTPIDRSTLKRMTPVEIVAAHAAGRLDHLLRGEG